MSIITLYLSLPLYDSVDATNNNLNRLCRYVNDSPKNKANCTMKIEEYKEKPYLVLYSKRHIPAFTELRFVYFDKISFFYICL